VKFEPAVPANERPQGSPEEHSDELKISCSKKTVQYGTGYGRNSFRMCLKLASELLDAPAHCTMEIPILHLYLLDKSCGRSLQKGQKFC
jgi:hypothetical protein